MLPVIEGLISRQRPVFVLTDPNFRVTVNGVGAKFLNLFEYGTIESSDSTSIPVPSRYVTFAASFAKALTRKLASLKPCLIIYDTFAVVAPLIALGLGVPYINICAGHALIPSQRMAELRSDPRVATSDACLRAVQILSAEYGLLKASPFSYVDNLSPHLNIYGEPSQFLLPEHHAALAPLAFFGSLPSPSRLSAGEINPFAGSYEALKVYVSFGTVIWKYYQDQALAALRVITRVLSEMKSTVVVSFGENEMSAQTLSELNLPNVSLHGFVDQWAALRHADVFITHHGLNSTHEAIFHGVPMLSCPFFADQPFLARRCQDLGIALPICDSLRSPIDPEQLRIALESLLLKKPQIDARLNEARSWELETIQGRSAVLDRILAFSLERLELK
jgi:MGT family glycosyltransferase